MLTIIPLMVGMPVLANVELDDPESRVAYELYNAGQKDKAISIFSLKAHSGYSIAQYNLAVIYSEDRENELHEREFKYWLKRAADSGDRDAQFNLAMEIYLHTEDQSRMEKTINWLQQSASNGNVKAQYNLGFLAFSNVEVDVSQREGLNWLQSAAKVQDDRAIKLLQLLQENLSEGAPRLYRPEYRLKTIDAFAYFMVNVDQTEVFAFPTTRQEPVLKLDRGVRVKVKEKRDDWIGIQISEGYPAWVAADEITIEGDVATVRGFEASMYVAPKYDNLVFKYGVAYTGDQLKVIDVQDGWVNVYTPEYIVAWVKKSALVGIYSDNAEANSTNSADLTEFAVDETNTESEVKAMALDKSFLVYGGDSTSSELLGVVGKGNNVTVIEQKGDFSLIQWQGGVEAWVYGKFLDVQENLARVTSNNVRVRTEPNTGDSAAVVTLLNEGEEILVVDSDKDWYRIIINPEGVGWVRNL